MALYLKNDYGRIVYAAIIYPHPAWCTPPASQPWWKTGWWQVPADGRTIRVLGGDLSPKWMYYVHAEASDGVTWGDQIQTRCDDYWKFGACIDDNISTHWPWKSFTGIHATDDDWTVRFVE